MRTTLDLPDSLFREVKARAAQNGMSLKDLLTRYVEAGLRSGAPDGRKPRTRSLPPVAIRRDPSLPPTQARDNRALSELQAIEDVARAGAGGKPATPGP